MTFVNGPEGVTFPDDNPAKLRFFLGYVDDSEPVSVVSQCVCIGFRFVRYLESVHSLQKGRSQVRLGTSLPLPDNGCEHVLGLKGTVFGRVELAAQEASPQPKRPLNVVSMLL